MRTGDESGGKPPHSKRASASPESFHLLKDLLSTPSGEQVLHFHLVNQFLPQHADVPRGSNAHADVGAIYAQDHDLDVVAHQEAFAQTTGQDEHR